MSAEQKWPDSLVLVRHAESERNVASREARRNKLEEYGTDRRDMSARLSEPGREQAQHVAAAIAERRFDWIFCSPYRRCRQTADIIRERLPQAPEVLLDDRLREREFGIWEGLTRAGRMARYPDEWQRFLKLRKYYYRPPGGENYPDVGLRVHSFLGTLTRECAGQRVMVVTHSVVIQVFRRLLERITEGQFLAMDSDPSKEIRNCSLTEYVYDRERRKLKLECFSRACYPPELLCEQIAEA